MNNFYGTSNIRGKYTLVSPHLKQVLEHVDLGDKFVFVFVDKTEHEAEDFRTREEAKRDQSGDHLFESNLVFVDFLHHLIQPIECRCHNTALPLFKIV